MQIVAYMHASYDRIVAVILKLRLLDALKSLKVVIRWIHTGIVEQLTPCILCLEALSRGLYSYGTVCLTWELSTIIIITYRYGTTLLLPQDKLTRSQCMNCKKRKQDFHGSCTHPKSVKQGTTVSWWLPVHTCAGLVGSASVEANNFSASRA